MMQKYRNELLVAILFGITLVGLATIAPPFIYPAGSVVTIPSGTTVAEAGQLLHERGIIRSAFIFSVFVRVFNSEGGVLQGSYSFERKESVIHIAYRLSQGATGLTPVKVTIPEGSTVRDIAVILQGTLKEFDAERFRILAKQYEGYLFPDTYFFLPGTPPETVIKAMRDTFAARTATLEDSIAAFGAPFSDVVIMASLLEKEARLTETRRIVAGILWKRLESDFPLQVDAVFGYIFERDTYSPTFDDLEIDSPYNTYKNLGLPPGPIANPGLDAMEAALTPIKTPYFYYLTGKDGTMHYARTFEEHVANRRYLR